MKIVSRGILNQGQSGTNRAVSTFPTLTRLADGSLLATYRVGREVETALHIFQDDIESPSEEKLIFDGGHQWHLQVEYFAERVLAGLPLEFPAEDGVANMRVIDAIYASARRGVPVDVT